MRQQLTSLVLCFAIGKETCDGQRSSQRPRGVTIAMSDPRIAYVGRYGTVPPAQTALSPSTAVRIGYPGAGFLVAVRGSALGLRLNSTGDNNALTVVVDHGAPRLIVPTHGEQVVPLLDEAAGSADSDHIVEVYKRSETWQGLIDLEALLPGPAAELLEAPRLPVRKLLFVGDSVTCGSGVARDESCTKNPQKPNEDPYHAFGMVLGRRLDAQADLVCYGGRGLQRDYRGLARADGVLNAPDYLDLAVATDEKTTRQSWAAKRWVPDAVVVELGTNDFNLQKTKPLDGGAFVRDYATLLHRLRAEFPTAVIFATEGPIVTDPLLRAYVRQAVVGAHDRRIVWAPSKHYPGNSCDGHPTLEQHGHMADDLEPQMREELGW